MAKQPALPACKAFLHVIYEHRYFALAAAASERFGLPSSDEASVKRANELLREIGVPVRDSLLLHARNLIEFYSRARPGKDPTTGVRVASDARPDDILLVDFSIPPPPDPTCQALRAFKDEISVHLGHLTAWRDTDYRTRNAASARGQTRQRSEWDQAVLPLIAHIFDALDHAASSAADWAIAFEVLKRACVARRADPGTDWPGNLVSEDSVAAYLRQEGLC